MRPGNDFGRAGLSSTVGCESLHESASELLGGASADSLADLEPPW
jgi:hypothetical protein